MFQFFFNFLTFNWVSSAFHFNDGAVSKEFLKGRRVNRSGHDDHSKVSMYTDHIPQQNDEKVSLKGTHGSDTFINVVHINVHIKLEKRKIKNIHVNEVKFKFEAIK